MNNIIFLKPIPLLTRRVAITGDSTFPQYIALKRLGVETKLIRFPGESHDLSRSGKPKHRLVFR
jgi:dipeptidyl aminopeptidase/acylaminoacyl peptidase